MTPRRYRIDHPEPTETEFLRTELDRRDWEPALERAWRKEVAVGEPDVQTSESVRLSVHCLRPYWGPWSAGLSSWRAWIGPRRSLSTER